MEEQQWLRFNGDSLGVIENLFDFVVWISPFILPSDSKHDWFYVQIFYQGNFYYAWMRSFVPQQVSTVSIIDELKPFFGMRKIGTHSFTTSGRLFFEEGEIKCKKTRTSYVLFQAKVIQNEDGTVTFKEPLSSFNLPITSEYVEQIQKYTIFREIIGINARGLESFFLLDSHLIPIDTNLNKDLTNPKKISGRENQKLFPSLLLRKDITETMLRIDETNLDSRLAEIGNRLNILLNRIDKKLVANINIWISNIRNRMEIYLSIKEDIEYP